MLVGASSLKCSDLSEAHAGTSSPCEKFGLNSLQFEFETKSTSPSLVRRIAPG